MSTPLRRCPRQLFRAAVALVFLLVAALTGCADDPPEGNDGAYPTPAPESPIPSSVSPEDVNEADITFVQLMVPHHDQAVEMSNIMIDKDDVQEDVVGLAEQIRDGQEPAVETLDGWLETWADGAPPPSQDPFDTANGMLAPEQMQELDEADGPTASKLFLDLMLAHHEGSVALAETEVADGKNPAAVQHARNVVSTQETEIATIKEMLKNY